MVHAGWPQQSVSFRDIWKQTLETFRSLGDYAGGRGVRIGLETMQPGSVDEYAGLIFDIDHPVVGAAIDTGHIRGSSGIGLPPARRNTNDALGELITTLGDKVIHFHLTDVRGSEWQDHHPLGTGIVDFPRMFATLRHSRYEGLLVFELEEPEPVGALEASKAFVETLMRP